MKSYARYVKKATNYEVFGLKRKAIEVMKKAISQPFSNLEIGSGNIYIGLLYIKLKESHLASAYFETALKLCEKEQYPYSPNYKKLLECFIENGDTDKAHSWYNHLIERAS